MTCTRLQNHKNMVVGEHRLQNIRRCGCCGVAFAIVIDVFVPTCAHPLLFLERWFLQIFLNINSLQEI